MAICCAASALILWNLGTRSPDAIARDMMHGVTSPRPFLIGLIRLTLGAFLAYIAISLVAHTLRYGPTSIFSAFAIGTFLAALAVDALIGDSVRKALGIRR